MNPCDLTFWQDVLSNLLATLLGVVIGIPVAFYIDRRVSARQESKEKIKSNWALNQRKKQLLLVLKNELQKNLLLLEQMQQELPNMVIFYTVDSIILDETNSLRSELFDDQKFNNLINSIRYEISHLRRKIDLQLDIAFRPGMEKLKWQLLVQAIIDHFPRIRAESQEAIKLIDDFLSDPKYSELHT